MIDDAGQEIELGMWYRLLEQREELLTEVKRLREAIADIAKNMEAAAPSYLQGFIRDLLEVIE